VKTKIGRDALADAERVLVARGAIGDAELLVGANCAYAVQQALRQAEILAKHDVLWFEEPVSSDDLAGLHALRARAPEGMPSRPVSTGTHREQIAGPNLRPVVPEKGRPALSAAAGQVLWAILGDRARRYTPADLRELAGNPVLASQAVLSPHTPDEVT
jgi:hypothetical protein